MLFFVPVAATEAALLVLALIKASLDPIRFVANYWWLEHEIYHKEKINIGRNTNNEIRVDTTFVLNKYEE